MSTRAYRHLLSSVLVLAGVARATLAAEQQIVLRDFINRQWTRELVTFPFRAGQGACAVGSVRLDGPKGPVPVQLWRVEHWPGTTWVKSARLSFVADLARLATDTYTVHYGPTPATPAAPATDLEVTRDKEQVAFTTATFGIRLLVGDKTYAEPVSGQRVPGPVKALWLPSQKGAPAVWFGGSRMYGDRKIRAYSARVTAAGPVLGEVRVRYTYEDHTTLDITARLAAGDSQVWWDQDVQPVDRKQVMKDLRGGWGTGDPLSRTDPASRSGWRLMLSPGLDPLRVVAIPEFYENRWGKHVYVRGKWVADPVDVKIEDEPPGLLLYLVPWRDWWAQSTRTDLTFNTPSRGTVLVAEARDAGVWVEPGEPGTHASWRNRRMGQKWIPLVRGKDGSAFLQLNLASGQRRWLLRGAQPPLGRRLNQLTHYVLDWKQAAHAHPRLYINRDQLAQARRRKPDPAEVKRLMAYGRRIQPKPHHSDCGAVGAWLLTGSPAVAKQVRLVERLRHHLDLMGEFDLMRSTFLVCALYDAVMGSDLITDADRREFRAKMAYLGYKMADAGTWSMERGYASGNLNMSIAFVLNQGILACTLADHPAAKDWLKSGLAMLERMLAEKVGPDGEWPESVANYANVSTSALLPLAVAAKNAGFADHVNDPRMKRLLLYLAKQYTPPDPRHTEQGKGGRTSLLPPVGRGGAGGRCGLHGLMARATRESDPGYSAVQQWVWLRSGQPRKIPDSRLGGWEHVYMDPTLPAKTPDWQLDLFRRTGAIMRQGLGAPNEWYVYLMAERTFGYPSESGGFPLIFAKGVPISARFAGGYAEREELLISRVLLARKRGTNPERADRFYHRGRRDITATSALPRQQYVRCEMTIQKPRRVSHESGAPWNHMKPLPQWPAVAREGKPPITWQRQVLFVRDDTPGGTGYLVLRDTVVGGQPTMWQFWTVSDKIGTPEQAALRKAFLADAPGDKMADARRLPPGNRYTAVGPYGVDVEFYIAAPSATPRHTLRWGTSYPYSPSFMYKEYQDMLHLQRMDDGVYYIVVFPRKTAEPVPTFQTLADGGIIKVGGAFGTDYVFLSSSKVQAKDKGIRFDGTAASVQDRPTGLVLSLGAGGEVAYGDHALRCDTAVSWRVQGQGATVALTGGHRGATVSIRAPVGWRLADGQTGVEAVEGHAPWRTFETQKGLTGFRLTK